jgi:phosphoribosylformylglycinamidine (FGAM) synthase-like enzyme
MALGGGHGIELNLGQIPHTSEANRADVLAFSESLARFIVEVEPTDIAAFEAAMAGLPIAEIGLVRSDDRVQFNGPEGQAIIETDLKAVEYSWRGHL